MSEKAAEDFGFGGLNGIGGAVRDGGDGVEVGLIAAEFGGHFVEVGLLEALEAGRGIAGGDALDDFGPLGVRFCPCSGDGGAFLSLGFQLGVLVGDEGGVQQVEGLIGTESLSQDLGSGGGAFADGRQFAYIGRGEGDGFDGAGLRLLDLWGLDRTEPLGVCRLECGGLHGGLYELRFELGYGLEVGDLFDRGFIERDEITRHGHGVSPVCWSRTAIDIDEPAGYSSPIHASDGV